VEALAIEGMARVRLGYDTLVKLKLDELLENEGYCGQFQPNGRRRVDGLWRTT
jgi:hypothetical protein